MKRTIDYLRISITDRCNLRCTYCMPDGIKTCTMSEILTFEELLIIVEQAAALGIKKVKITGGEPLVRKGCIDLIRRIKNTDGIEQVTLTTNGVTLCEYLYELKELGIDGINISLDTLDPKQYEAITGSDKLNEVLKAVYLSVKLGIKTKINAVSLQDTDWRSLVLFAKNNPVDVRFIELMPIGAGKDFKGLEHRTLIAQFKEEYPEMKMDERIHGNGPAVYYNIDGFKGSIGFISAIHNKFCSSCNRIRLTSTGYLKTCLCFEDGVDLKGIIRGADGKPVTDADAATDETNQKIRQAMADAIAKKPLEHCFGEPESVTESHGMSAIGG